MSKAPHDAIFVERLWPPLRVWGYFLLPLVLIAIPAPFLGLDYWAAVGGLGGGYFVIVGVALAVDARRYWWVTAEELEVSRAPLFIRVFYPGSGGRHVPLNNIERLETVEGKSREILRAAYGSVEAAGVRSSLGGCHKAWCRSSLIVRLRQPDEYGDTVLLSTVRLHEASSMLTRAIQDADRRRGTAT